MKVTQEKAFFYILWKHHNCQNHPGEYIPVWKFVGELFIEELGQHFFMSYKCPSNGANVHLFNPGLTERVKIKGKSGAEYYGYRMAEPFDPSKILDPRLAEFYESITSNTLTS